MVKLNLERKSSNQRRIHPKDKQKKVFRFQSSENPEDREDDEAFLGRLNQMFDRGLNVQTVCAGQCLRKTK